VSGSHVLIGGVSTVRAMFVPSKDEHKTVFGDPHVVPPDEAPVPGLARQVSDG
jgi:hypothetical protein